MKDLLTIDQLAEHLQNRGLLASPWTVRRRVHRGELLPAQTSPRGAYLFVLDDALTQWLRGPRPIAAT